MNTYGVLTNTRRNRRTTRDLLSEDTPFGFGETFFGYFSAPGSCLVSEILKGGLSRKESDNKAIIHPDNRQDLE